MKDIDREMSNESNNNNSNGNGPSEKKTLSLGKSVGQGTVRQSFSHGRSKPVVVEKRKRRFTAPGETKPAGRAESNQSASGTPASSAAPKSEAPREAKNPAQGQSQGGQGGRGAGGGGKGQRNRQPNRGQGNGASQGGNATGQRNLTSSENAKRLQALEAAKSSRSRNGTAQSRRGSQAQSCGRSQTQG